MSSSLMKTDHIVEKDDFGGMSLGGTVRVMRRKLGPQDSLDVTDAGVKCDGNSGVSLNVEADLDGEG